MQRSYTRVSNESRLHFIKLVIQQNMSIKDAAEMTEIKYENAKAILTVFKQQNRINKFKNCRTKDAQTQGRFVMLPSSKISQNEQITADNNFSYCQTSNFYQGTVSLSSIDQTSNKISEDHLQEINFGQCEQKKMLNNNEFQIDFSQLHVAINDTATTQFNVQAISNKKILPNPLNFLNSFKKIE